MPHPVELQRAIPKINRPLLAAARTRDPVRITAHDLLAFRYADTLLVRSEVFQDHLRPSPIVVPGLMILLFGSGAAVVRTIGCGASEPPCAGTPWLTMVLSGSEPLASSLTCANVVR